MSPETLPLRSDPAEAPRDRPDAGPAVLLAASELPAPEQAKGVNDRG